MSAIGSYPSLADLPGAVRARCEANSASGPFHTLPWFELLAASCPEPDGAPFVMADADGGTVSVLRERRSGGRQLEAFGNFYTCEYSPLLGSLAPREQAERFSEALTRLRPRVDTLHLQNMRADQVDVALLARTLRARGWGVQVYEQFGNWHEPVSGVDYATYLAERDGQLRSTIERKTKRFQRLPGASLEVATTGEAIERGLAAYLDVHARSWKEPEPYPNFIPDFVRAFAACGRLWIGTAMAEGRPLAAQLWLVWERRITIAKLAYVDDAKKLSPGTVLSAHMFRTALDRGGYDEIDLGRGDDPYKRQWLKRRRPVLGLVAGNLRTLRGAFAAARHLGPQALKRLAAGIGLRRR